MMKLAMASVAGAALAAATAAQDPVVVRTKTDFLALVGDVVTEGFEGFPTDFCSSGGASPSSTINTPLMTITSVPQAGGTSFLCIGTSGNGGPVPTEGNNALNAGSNTGDPWILTFSLTDAAVGVWFELTDAVERGDAFISIPDGLADIQIAQQGEGGATPIGFGIITTEPFTEFSLINTGISDGWGVDDITLAQIGLPASFRTFGIGCPGPQGIPTLGPPFGGSIPVAGQSFSVQVNNLPLLATTWMLVGSSTTQYGNLTLPYDLGNIGLSGCTLWVSGSSHMRTWALSSSSSGNRWV